MLTVKFVGVLNELNSRRGEQELVTRLPALVITRWASKARQVRGRTGKHPGNEKHLMTFIKNITGEVNDQLRVNRGKDQVDTRGPAPDS